MTEDICKGFGKLWDSRSVECRGGADPTYTNPVDGTNRRDICKWYSQCGARFAATQNQAPPMPQFAPQQQQLQMPPAPPSYPMQSIFQGVSQFVRPVVQGFQQAQPQQQPVRMVPQTQMQPQQPQYPQPQYGYAQPILVDPRMATNPYVVPMNYPSPGAQMPSYLTVPEPLLDSQPWYVRLGLILFRSMIKAVGHSVANYADHSPLNRWPTPPQG